MMAKIRIFNSSMRTAPLPFKGSEASSNLCTSRVNKNLKTLIAVIGKDMDL